MGLVDEDAEAENKIMFAKLRGFVYSAFLIDTNIFSSSFDFLIDLMRKFDVIDDNQDVMNVRYFFCFFAFVIDIFFNSTFCTFSNPF